MKFNNVTFGSCSFGKVNGVPAPVTTKNTDILVYRDIPVATAAPVTGTSGLGPVSYALVNTLPVGLTYNQDGTISGESTQVVPTTTMTVNTIDIFNQITPTDFNFTSLSSSDQRTYSTPGSYVWTVPSNVFSISVVCVGAGGSGGASYATSAPVYSPGGGGGGGGLSYVNSISVSPGQQFNVVVGAGGASVKRSTANTVRNGNNGGDSSFGDTIAIARGGAGGQGGYLNNAGAGGTGGTHTGSGGNGGNGGNGSYSAILGGGGGGAGGYAGNGGNGGTHTGSATTGVAGSAGTGGAAGGGSSGVQFSTFRIGGASGGGVGLLGQGDSGSQTDTPLDSNQTVFGGRAGSGGTNGFDLNAIQNTNYGSPAPGSVGGGGGGESLTGTVGSGAGANGAVRIIWQGTRRFFPTTRTANE